MADSDGLAAAFEEHRDRLRAVAYRMLGSVNDADDAVQDTWLRLASPGPAEIENLGGWLTTVIARVCLNMLRARRRHPEQPAGDAWPGQAPTPEQARAGTGPGVAGVPEDEAVLADSVGLALLVVLETLTPPERLALVLHDMFAMPFTEVAEVLGRSPDATRQLASRARRRVRGAEPPGQSAGQARQREVTAAFLAAARGGDLTALVALLDEQVTLTADAAAVPSGRPVSVRGRDLVAQGAIAASVRAEGSQLALVDGMAGIVFAPAGQLRVVLVLTVDPDRRVTAIDVIGDPARLCDLHLALLPDQAAAAGVGEPDGDRA
jgi:RNA polymerase sigma factor (sigma-70 family)